MPVKGVHKVAVGDPMRASQHNALVDAFRSITPHPVITEPFAEVFIGVIEALGPDSEADYADERYWVREQYISDTTGDHTDGFTLADVSIPTTGFGRWITAENLAEKAGATHDLAAGTFVQVFLAYDAASPGVVRYFFSQALAVKEWETLSGNPDNVDNGGSLAGGGTGAGKSAHIFYTDDALDGEQWVFEAFEEDGSGDSVAVTLQDSVWFKISARIGIYANPGTQNGGSVLIDKVTTQFDATALNWGALPTRVNLGECALLSSPEGNPYAQGQGSFKYFLAGPFTGLTDVHGICYRWESLSAGNDPGETWASFGYYNIGAAIKWRTPGSEFMQGVS